MPFAELRKAPELNRAYAYVSEPSFAEAATALRDKLVAMGFDEEEATLNIEQALRDEDQLPLEGGAFGEPHRAKPTMTETVPTKIAVSGIAEKDQKAVSVTKTDDGQYQVLITGHVTDETISAITDAVEPRSERNASGSRSLT